MKSSLAMVGAAGLVAGAMLVQAASVPTTHKRTPSLEAAAPDAGITSESLAQRNENQLVARMNVAGAKAILEDTGKVMTEGSEALGTSTSDAMESLRTLSDPHSDGNTQSLSSDKLSPANSPRGIQWKPTFDEAVRDRLLAELAAVSAEVERLGTQIEKNDRLIERLSAKLKKMHGSRKASVLEKIEKLQAENTNLSQKADQLDKQFRKKIMDERTAARAKSQAVVAGQTSTFSA